MTKYHRLKINTSNKNTWCENKKKLYGYEQFKEKIYLKAYCLLFPYFFINLQRSSPCHRHRISVT